jgi:flagellar biosynthesis protein FliP
MKNKGIILGVMLIIGLFLMGPVSASKLIDHGHKTVYDKDFDSSGTYTWKTYKISKYYIKIYQTENLKNGVKLKIITTITNIKPHKIKMTIVATMNGIKLGNKTLKFKSHGYNALKFYNVAWKSEVRNPI